MHALMASLGQGVDGGAGGGPPKRQRVSKELCPLLEMGGCNRGDSCPFAHNEHELISAGLVPPARPPTMGGIPMAQPGAASAQTWKPPKESKYYKFAVCEFWQVGRCTKGAECTWAHGEHELAAQPVPLYQQAASSGGRGRDGKEACWFHERGACTKGDTCKFSHDLVPVSPIGPSVPPGSAAAGGSCGDITQPAVLYQQIAAQSAAQSAALVAPAAAPTAPAGTDPTAAALAAAGYDEQTLTALYHYQALQALLMAQQQAAGATEAAGGALQDPATAAWVAALAGQGLLSPAAPAPANLASGFRSGGKGGRSDICYDLRDKGFCRFGVACKFSHDNLK